MRLRSQKDWEGEGEGASWEEEEGESRGESEGESRGEGEGEREGDLSLCVIELKPSLPPSWNLFV